MSGGNICLCTYYVITDLSSTVVGINSTFIKTYKYVKKYSDSVLEIYFDTDYRLDAYGDDTFYSRLYVDSTTTPTNILSTRTQVFRQNNGGDNRSGTLFPISGIKSGLPAGNIYVSIYVDTNPANDEFFFRKNGTLIIREYTNFSSLTSI